MTETNIMFMPIILIFKKEKHQWMCIKMMELKFLQQRGSLFPNPYLLPPFLCGGTFLKNLAPTWTIFMLKANYSCDSKAKKVSKMECDVLITNVRMLNQKEAGTMLRREESVGYQIRFTACHQSLQ